MEKWGVVELKVSLDKSNLTSELIKTFNGCQEEAEKNKIVYKIAGDKSSLESMLKQIQGLKPELLTKLNLEFDKSYYENEMNVLRNTAGKTAEKIGQEFKDSISTSLQGFNVGSLIGKKLKKGSILEESDISNISNALNDLVNKTKGFKLTDATSVTEIKEQLTAYQKMKIIVDEIANKQYVDKSNKLVNIDVRGLQSRLSQVDSIMGDVGNVIHQNASQWMTTLESSFNNEFGNVITLFNNLKEIMAGTFSGGFGGAGNNTSKELDEINQKIAETTAQLEKAKNKLEELKTQSSTSSVGSVSDIEKNIEDSVEKLNASGKGELIGDKWDKEGSNLLSLVEQYKKAGGEVSELEKKFAKFKSTMSDIKSVGLKIGKGKVTNVIDPKIIQEQETLVNSLTQQLQDLNAEKEKLITSRTTDQSPTPGDPNAPTTPTNANVSPVLSPDFKEKLQEQVTAIGAVNTNVAPVLETDFKERAQEAVTGLGNVNIGVNFSDAKKEGEKTQEIPVNVIATPKLSENFQGDMQSLIDQTGSYKISVKSDNESKDNSVQVKAIVENGEEFKTNLKQTIEGTDGLDIKVKPIVEPDFKLEIQNAVLKNVEVEGEIKGGHLKPASVDVGGAEVTTPAPATETQNAANQEQALEKVKEEYTEVGQAAETSGQTQKRSLLDVIKEIQRVEAEQKKLMDLESVVPDNSMRAFIEEKKKDAQEYVHVQELIAKIQTKINEPITGSTSDMTKHFAGIVAYVERLKVLMESAFSYDVLGENGENEFNKMKEAVDKASGSVDDANKKVREFNKQLLSLRAEKSALEQTATDAEKLEANLYSAAKAIDALKEKKGVKYNKFVNLYDQYRIAGGTQDISAFTDEKSTIEAVRKSYAGLTEERKNAADVLKTTRSVFNPDIDMSQFDDLFKKIETGALTAQQATVQLDAAIKALKATAAESPVGTGSATGTIPTTPETPATPEKPIKPGATGEINVVPKVEDTVAFANAVTEQVKGQSANIDVKPVVSVAEFSGQVTEQLKGAFTNVDTKPNLVEQTTNSLEATIDKLRNAQKELESKAVGTTGMSIDAIAEKIKQLQGIMNKTLPAAKVGEVDYEYSAFNDDLKRAMTKMPNTKKEIDLYMKQLMSGAEYLTNEMATLLSYVGEFGSYNDKEVFKTQKDQSKAKYIYDSYQKMQESIKQDQEAYKQASHELFNLLDKTDEKITSGTSLASKLKGSYRIESIKDKLLTSGTEGNNIYRPNQTAIQMFDEGQIKNVDDVTNKIRQLESVLGQLNTKYTESKSKLDAMFLTDENGWYEQSKAVKALEKDIEHYSQQLRALESLQRNHESFNQNASKELASQTVTGNNKSYPIQIPVEADINSLNTSLQSKKEQILPVDVKVNAIPVMKNTDETGTTGMSAEVTQAESLRSKISEVTTAVNAKTRAFKEEKQIVVGAVKLEISAIKALNSQLELILQTLGKINGYSITLNMTEGSNFFDSVSNTKSVIDGLRESLNGIDSSSLSNLTTVLSALKIDESVGKNIQSVANAILNLKTNLNNISPSSTDFINSIKELASQKDALQNLATVISATKEQLKEAQDTVTKASGQDTSKTSTQMDNLINKFEQAAKKAGILYDTSSLRINDNGVITFTTTIEKLGEKATITKYKIDDLNNALNKDGSLSKNYLNTHSEEKGTKIDNIAEKMAAGRDRSNLKSQKLDRQSELAQSKAINKSLEQEYKERQKNIIATNKQIELNRKAALSFTKNASQKLSSAISRYSYGDTSDANAMLKQMNLGVTDKFGDLSRVKGTITQLSSTIEKIVADLKSSHEQSLKALNEEIQSENKLQTQRDQFNKSNMNGIDLLIKKREEEVKSFSASLKAQMEANAEQTESERKLAEKMAAGRERANEKTKKSDRQSELAQSKAINKSLEEEYQQRQKNIDAEEKQIELNRQMVLNFTKSATNKLSSAISRYSYGDTSDANAMMKQMNLGVSGSFGDLSRVQGTIAQLSSTIDKIITDLKSSHEQSLKALNEEIQAENKLQTQKDQFNKKNINGIDYEIQKREESARSFSVSLKAQMEEEQKLAEQMAAGRERANEKTKKLDKNAELAQAKAINKSIEKEYQAQLDSEKQLQAQRDQFNKSNINGIDLLIKKREEEARSFSTSLKAQMEASAAQTESERKLAEQMAAGRERSNAKTQNLDRQSELAQSKAINKALEEEYQQRQKNIEAEEKQIELSKQKALSITKSLSGKLSSAVSKYSYGDVSDARSMLEQLNLGLNNFGDLSNVQGIAEQLSSTVEKIVADLKSSHEQSLKALNEEIQAENKLQTQKDAFNKKNINGIDYEIQKREEAAKIFSSTLKADMEKRYGGIDQGKVDEELLKTKSLMDQIFAEKQNVSGFQNAFDRAQAKIDELNKKLEAGKISNIQYRDEVNKIFTALNTVVGSTNPLGEDPNAIKQAEAMMRNYAQSINDGNVKIGDFNQKTGKMIVTFEKEKGVLQEVELSWNRITGTISAMPGKTKKTYSYLTSFVDGLKARFKSLLQYLTIFVSYYRIIGMIKEGVQVVRDLDTALTEMRKVSDESVDSLKKFQDTSFDIAKTVGTTAKQIQDSTADFMRLGESLEEAAESAKVANILLNVSEFESIDEATESLVSMAAAFNDLEKIEIVDKLNLIGNNFAISTDGLASALQDSASALKTAGNDIDEAIALTTAANQVVQDPDKVGAGLRTIALRITGTEAAKEELQELGEDVDDFVVRTTSKTQQKIKDFTRVASNNFTGFDILDDNGNFKSTYEILLGISEIYDEIVESDKKYGSNMANGLLETLAGKNRANIAASILQSPDTLKQAYDASSNDSANSAQIELEKYLDSIEGKIQQFTNEVQEFWHNLISSEFVKGVVDIGTTIMDVLGEITDKFGALGLAIAGLGAGFGLNALKQSGGRVKMFALII